MGDTWRAERVKLICGMISADEAVMKQVETELAGRFGGIDLRSDLTPFDYTDYYEKEMGAGLLRRFVSFAGLIDPGELAGIKLFTNSIEQRMAHGSGKRTINLDPGYVTAAKLVLATTKDFAHRVYLRDGIYAEVTLNFRKSGPVFFDWTYPDFKSGRYNDFLAEARRMVMAAGQGAS
jgi:hypothetical protein